MSFESPNDLPGAEVLDPAFARVLRAQPVAVAKPWGCVSADDWACGLDFRPGLGRCIICWQLLMLRMPAMRCF